MDGYNTLWLPGTDHAGINTQWVVEQQLAREGNHRHAYGREQFIDRVWRWREESGRTIVRQLMRLGASCDWSRERFTMDEGLSRAVRSVRDSVPGRPHLPWQLYHSVVPSLYDGTLRPRSRI